MTFATTERVFERPFGAGAGVSLVDSVTATGASPFSFTVPGGAAEGDIAILCAKTINSIPDAAGPSGGATWNQVAYADLSSSDYSAVWWKVLGGSEPASWGLTHSAGTDTAGAVVVLRAPGVDALLSYSIQFPAYTPGWVPAHPLGFQVLVYMGIDSEPINSMPSGESVSTGVYYVSASPNECQIGVAYRDTISSMDALPIRCGGRVSTYSSAMNMTFYPS